MELQESVSQESSFCEAVTNVWALTESELQWIAGRKLTPRVVECLPIARFRQVGLSSGL